MSRCFASLNVPSSSPSPSTPTNLLCRQRYTHPCPLARANYKHCRRERAAWIRAAAAGAAAPGGGAVPQSGTPAATKPKTPIQQQILNGILAVSNVPYRCGKCSRTAPAQSLPPAGVPPADPLHHRPARSSFVPSPVTFLHTVDARIKQVGPGSMAVTLTRGPCWPTRPTETCSAVRLGAWEALQPRNSVLGARALPLAQTNISSGLPAPFSCVCWHCTCCYDLEHPTCRVRSHESFILPC